MNFNIRFLFTQPKISISARVASEESSQRVSSLVSSDRRPVFNSHLLHGAGESQHLAYKIH